ncbi:MAG TPA: host attachment protein [Gammaproteobacteria bacterium]|nr:host attachment protein [Gammaproteobacteria bacterium]
MSEYCVVVCNGTRARFFTLEPVAIPEVESGPNLVEHADLVNPEVDVPGRETWTDLKSGRNTAPGAGPAHGYDDHRDDHEDEFMRRFADKVAQQAVALVQEHKAGNLVLAASSRMLGFLRNALQLPPTPPVTVKEVAKDLSKLSPLEIHQHLSEDGLLPARKRAAV